MSDRKWLVSAKRIMVDVLFMLLSDMYRMIAAALDWRCHRRVLSGGAKYDVAFITNFENDLQKGFMGIFRWRPVAYGLRFSLGSSLCRYLLINRSAHDLTRPKSQQIGKHYARAAIGAAICDGARIILFAAGTKRLFSESELAGIRRDYPGVIFTIGDNGTALALLSEVAHAIELRVGKDGARIAVLGPNGFLGGVTAKFLRAIGCNDLQLLSSSKENPFAGVHGVDMIVACSHHAGLKLTADILRRISSESGVHVIDVCRPSNLSRGEFMKCTNVTRQDSGMVHNAGIKYVFPQGAQFVLRRLGISTRILYGCFAEAVALSALPQEDLRGFDFLSVNSDTMKLIGHAFTQAGFAVSPVQNYGEAETMDAPYAGWCIAKHL